MTSINRLFSHINTDVRLRTFDRYRLQGPCRYPLSPHMVYTAVLFTTGLIVSKESSVVPKSRSPVARLAVATCTRKFHLHCI